MGENNINFTTISCVYDLLQSSEKSCTWNANGDISIMRPNVNTNLNSIKFRSFSANIRANINNLTSPIINAKLYGAFTWYKNQKGTITESETTDQVTGTEIPITPYISNLSCSIYNQTGLQQYEAANGLYHNDINNEIIFKEFGVPLNTTFQDAVYDMFHYAKYEFMKLMGVYDKPNNENVFKKYIGFNEENYSIKNDFGDLIGEMNIKIKKLTPPPWETMDPLEYESHVFVDELRNYSNPTTPYYKQGLEYMKDIGTRLLQIAQRRSDEAMCEGNIRLISKGESKNWYKNVIGMTEVYPPIPNSKLKFCLRNPNLLKIPPHNKEPLSRLQGGL